MRVRWYGQSAFRLLSEGGTVFIDPFHLPGPEMAARGFRFEYPAIAEKGSDLLLITHEHFDHNAAEAVGPSRAVIRSTAGVLEAPVGKVTAIASEHDAAAGTQRGPNTIFVFSLDGLRVCHFGDFGQAALRPEQRSAIGQVDLLMLPVGGGPTIGADAAFEIVELLRPRWAVPMHYRTPAIGFLEPAEAFLARFASVERCPTSEFDTAGLPARGEPMAVVPAAPARG
jgi:L-ascorbate metabolism protein UlaG (beta-lactamase superfamily)